MSRTRYGEARETKVGQVLFRAGALPNYFVVLEGEVEVIDDFAGEARGTMGVFRPDRFVGDLNMLTGQAVSL
jgi:thioredoxin reductase (NADPH)